MVNPLAVGLGVSELVNALDVVDGFLVDLFLVKVPSSCVVCELAQKVLGFVSVAGCFVVRVGVGGRVVFVRVGAEALPWWFRLGCGDVCSVSYGVPFVLCSLCDLLYEFGE